MSLKGGLILPAVSRYAANPSHTLLPFLYQTRTLQQYQPAQSQKKIQRNCKSRHLSTSTARKAAHEDTGLFERTSDSLNSASEPDLTNPAIRYTASSLSASTTRKAAQGDVIPLERTSDSSNPFSKPNSINPAIRYKRYQSPTSTTPKAAQEDAIPFERTLDSSNPANEPDLANPAMRYLSKIKQRPQDSTITNSEQAVFDRIFKDIATAGSTEHDRYPDDIEPDDGAYFEDLDNIFENAISKHEKPKELDEDVLDPHPNYRRHYLLQNLPGLESLRLDLPPPEDWGRPGRIGSESISNVSKAHNQHRRKVFGMLDAAETDVEVWRILENEVFILIHEHNARIKEQEKAAKAKKTPSSNHKSSRAAATRSAKVGRPSEKALAAAKLEERSIASKALPPTVLLSILTEEYPLYLVACCRLLRRCFPQSSFSLAILPQVKQLGPVSYVLGASADLYNETLYLLWASKNDIHGMADLLQEMRNQGVESNDVTLSFLNGIRRRRRYEMSGKNGVWRQKWWGMGPVAEAWGRLWRGMEFVEQEQRERIMRAAEEKREAKEIDGEDEEGEETFEELEPVAQHAAHVSA